MAETYTDHPAGVAAPPPKDPESAFFSETAPAHRPLPLTPDLDPPGADRLGLSAEEIEQFRTQGYVIKRGLIPSADLAPFRELWWKQPPVVRAGVRREDPATWLDPGGRWTLENRWDLAHDWMGGSPWPSPEDERPGATVGERVGRLAHRLSRDAVNDVWRWHGLGHDPAFVAATSAHPRMLHMLEALMGGPVKRPWRNRGVYSIFPRASDERESRLGPHMDQNMMELSGVTLLDDVPPHSGGFTIFPTSPQVLYPTSEQALNWVATDASSEAIDRLKVDVQPVEFTGRAGDTIFAHGLVVHTAGLHDTDRLRLAVIQDFNKVRPRSHMRWTAAGKHGGPRVHCDMDGYFRFPTDGDDDPADGLREVTNQWIMDSNEFVLSRDAPFDDMFHDWNLGREPVRGHVIDEPPWWRKYGLPALPSATQPPGGGGMAAVPLSEVASYEGDGVWRVRSRANDWMER